MRQKLALLRSSLAALGQLPLIPSPFPSLSRSSSGGSASSSGSGSTSSSGGGAPASWREFWQTGEWGRVVEVHNKLSQHGFATLGTQAVAVAVWALVTNWRHPQQAVVVAASLGGNSSTTAALAGALRCQRCCMAAGDCVQPLIHVSRAESGHRSRLLVPDFTAALPHSLSKTALSSPPPHTQGPLPARSTAATGSPTAGGPRWGRSRRRARCGTPRWRLP
jgi:hypothetical protein